MSKSSQDGAEETESSGMEPKVISKKDVEIYRRYVSFGFRDRQVLSKPGLDIHGSAVLGSKLKHFVHDKVLDHETRFMPLLVAVCSFVEEAEQHLLNFSNINRPLDLQCTSHSIGTKQN